MNEISVRLARANNSQTSFNFKLGHTRPTGLNARLPFRSITMRRLSHSGSKRKDCFSYVLGKHSLSMRAFILFYMQTRRCELQEIQNPGPHNSNDVIIGLAFICETFSVIYYPVYYIFNFFSFLDQSSKVRYETHNLTSNVTHYYILHIFNYKLREMLGLLFILFHSFDIQFYSIIFFFSHNHIPCYFPKIFKFCLFKSEKKWNK